MINKNENERAVSFSIRICKFQLFSFISTGD